MGARPESRDSVSALMEERGIRECLQFFTREKQWINEQHLAVCRIPAPTFLEQARATWFAEQLRSYGPRVELDPAGNVVALFETDPEQPLIAVTSHLDTVLTPRNKDDITVDGEGKFLGPGVADNGAGLAAVLALARALTLSAGLPEAQTGLVFIATVGEEGEGNLGGMRYLAGQSPLAGRIRAYLVLDGPSLNHITVQALASRRLEVVFTGPGGHSWTDYGTPNPVHALSRTITSFADRFSSNGSSPKSAFNFGLVDAGASINSIPATARAKVDLRSENPERVAEMAQALSAVVEAALEHENQRATAGKLAAKLRDLGSRPAGQLPEDSPLLLAIRAVDTHLGIRARLNCSSTDANIPLSLGIPALSIGAGGQGGAAHTPSEWFRPEGRDLGLKRILLALALLVRDPLTTAVGR